jgi:hypothetical protein
MTQLSSAQVKNHPNAELGCSEIIFQMQNNGVEDSREEFVHSDLQSFLCSMQHFRIFCFILANVHPRKKRS